MHGFCCCAALILLFTAAPVWSRSDKEIRERFYGNFMNSSAPDTGEGSIAQMFDQVLEKEFSENEQPEGNPFCASNPRGWKAWKQMFL